MSPANWTDEQISAFLDGELDDELGRDRQAN